MQNKGDILFDLDGTLATYDGWKGELFIGEPIKEMVQVLNQYKSLGYNIKIFTARVSNISQEGLEAIINWCKLYLGCEYEITNQKDFNTILIIDDRCKQVVFNKGILVEEQLNKANELLSHLRKG